MMTNKKKHTDMNKTTTARVYTAPNTWEFSINGNLAWEQGYELISRYGDRGIIWAGGGLERRPIFCFFLLLLHKLSISLFSLLAWHKANQARGGVSASGYLVLLSSSPGGIPVLRPTFRFPFFFFCFLGYQRLWCSLSVFPPWLFGRDIFQLCLRGTAFTVLICRLYLD